MILTIIYTILVLSVLVLIHEFGHFWVAKKNGIWVEEFGVGYPPRIWGKKVGDTIYSINALPFGGFVRLHGEMDESGVSKPEKAFINKSNKVKAAVIVAGVVMNFILAVFAFAIVYSFSGVPKPSDVRVVGVSQDSPAADSDLRIDDYVMAVDGVQISSSSQFIEEVAKYKGKEVEILLRRNNTDNLTVKVTPRTKHPETEGPLGVAISDIEIYYPPVWQRPFVGIYYGFKDAIFWGWMIFTALMDMFAKLFMGVVPKDVAGPVGVFALTNEAAKMGLLSVINFMGIFSVNLAILNILPFPALDGGRLAFIILESITGKKLPKKFEYYTNVAGMAFLVGLLLIITFGDIRRLITSGGLDGFMQSFLQ